ncbi:hypothetical protein OAA09_00360 [bacterium]|nr:hypothetical protein [bacterium]
MIFPIILWSVAKDYFDMMTFEISSSFKIHNVKDYSFDENYEDFIRKIYEPDSIADWKITKKLERLDPYEKIARLIQIEIPDPAYRVKSDGNPISTVTEQIKRVFRQKYAFLKAHQDKPDVIIHMGDTHEHSSFITNVFEEYGKASIRKIDLPRFLAMIKEEDYALTKIEVPYMVENFPINYPVGKDLDILVSKESFYSVMSKLITFSRDYQKTFVLKDVPETDGIRVRFHKKFGNQELEYQIDITCSPLVSKNSISLGANYNTLKDEWECYSRLTSLKKKPHKTHHTTFIESRKDSMDIKTLKRLDLFDFYKQSFTEE